MFFRAGDQRGPLGLLRDWAAATVVGHTNVWFLNTHHEPGAYSRSGTDQATGTGHTSTAVAVIPDLCACGRGWAQRNSSSL